MAFVLGQHASLCACALAALLLSACSTGAKARAADAVLEIDDERRESFEATLRVLDEHPQWIDEFYAIALRHPKTLDRFFMNTAEHLDEEPIARMNARHLAKHPDSLRMVQVAVLDEVSDAPEAQRGLAQALLERAHVNAMVISQSEEAVVANMHALMKEAERNPRARRAVLRSLIETAPATTALLLDNPKTALELARIIADTGLDEVVARARRDDGGAVP